VKERLSLPTFGNICIWGVKIKSLKVKIIKLLHENRVASEHLCMINGRLRLWALIPASRAISAVAELLVHACVEVSAVLFESG